MLEPTGPLPPSVYWRRRVFAGVVCVLAVMLLAWIIGGLVGEADDQPVRGTSGSQALTGPPSSPPPSTRAAAPSSTTTTSPPPTSQAPAPLRPCPDDVITVVAGSGARSYRVGEHPLLRLTISNTGAVPCTREVNRELRELLITTANGRKRLWSSNDCYSPPDSDRRTLAPGKPLLFTLNWAGRTSAPGCPLKRTTVEAGRYRLTAKLGHLQSPPATLVLTAAPH